MVSTEKALGIMKGLVELFSTTQFPDTMSKAYIKAPDVPASKWSWNNRILIAYGGTLDARGYKQWEAVGRYPKKGTKAIYILGPRLINRKSDEDKDKKGKDGNGKEKKEKILVGFRSIPVFRYEDTEGKPLEEYKPKELPPLYDLAKFNGIDVRWTNTVEGECGSIVLENKAMRLSTESPDTFLHELIHFYDLKNRDDVVNGQDKTQEIVAQLGACVLAKMYGYDFKEYTWNYIASYSETKDPEKIGRECIAVINRVGKVIDEILNDAEKLAEDKIEVD